MTYRYPKTLPYLCAVLAAVLVVPMFLFNSRRPVLILNLSLIALGVVSLCAVFAIHAYRYTVTIATDKLIVGAFHRKEYPFAEMEKLEVWPGRGVRAAVITMKNGARVDITGNIKDFPASFARYAL